MKQTTKAWLITAAALVLIGILVFGGAMARHHWDFSALSTDKLETDTVDIQEEFQSISIVSDTADIAFLPSGDGTCSVVFWEWDQERHTASVRDGTLTIESNDTRSWLDHIGFRFSTPRITVYLPRAEYAALFIDESTGDVAIPADFAFESVDITASTGSVDCCASASGSVRIKTDTGGIRIESISAGELDLSVSTGRVDVRSVVCRGSLGVSVSTGEAFLTDVACGSAVSGGSTGDITLENVIAAGTITIERSTGDVKLDRCDAAELLIKTDTGDVTGSLLSEKVFIADSDTGRIDVPKTGTGGRCEISTDTGDIVIAVS